MQIRNFSGTTKITIPTEPPRGRESKSKDSSVAPHATGAASYGVVYVNELARDAMFNQKNPQFAVGSIIVREKLSQANDASAAPQQLAVLVKRERGFNPKASDWEFMMLDGDARTIRQREKTGSCRKCHAEQKKSDYVFRTYLPVEIRLKQR
ncbi:MAG: hypothetical protein QOF02_766 [Blastocatellia bacterium]|jgi:hypothetical protein|nr:hypothetical protein [Blastocatellia bacterium]